MRAPEQHRAAPAPRRCYGAPNVGIGTEARPSAGNRTRSVPARSSLADALKRDVLVEAEHRCAIPTCRQFPVHIRHVHEPADNGEDEFTNLIALCEGCYDRVKSGYLTRRSLEQYKANLSVINARYGDVERRVLQTFVQGDPSRGVLLPTGMEALMSFLARDGMVEIRVPDSESNTQRFPSFREYRLTDRGRKLVTRWAKAQPLE